MTSPTHGYTANKDALLKRLNRIEGQVRGIARMVEEDRYCVDVVTQISAVQAAIDRVALNLVTDHVHHCMTNADGDERAAKVDELMGAVARLLKTG